jgi:hypothetical protein
VYKYIYIYIYIYKYEYIYIYIYVYIYNINIYIYYMYKAVVVAQIKEVEANQSDHGLMLAKILGTKAMVMTCVCLMRKIKCVLCIIYTNFAVITLYVSRNSVGLSK